MKIGRFKVSKRAVSPVIATLLMIAIAVAASIIVYVWSIGLLGGLMGGGGSQVKEQVIMEAYRWPDAASASLFVTLRNVGSSQIQVDAVYLGGIKAGTNPWTTALNPGQSSLEGTVTVSGLTPTAGVAYTLKIVTKTGGVFTFSVIAGSTG